MQDYAFRYRIIELVWEFIWFKSILIESGVRMRKILQVGALVIVNLFAVSTVAMANPTSYVVKAGDSLWKIANSYGQSVNSLKQLNGLSSDLIFVGQSLTLSQPEVVQAAAPSPAAATPNPVSTSSSSYTVQAGDSLWSVAQKFGTTVDQLKSLNGLAGNTIYAGNTLRVNGTPVSTSTNVSRSLNTVNGNAVAAKAAQYLGTRYAYGGTTPSGFDCSGFTQYVFRQLNISINRTAAAQYSNGVAVAKANLVPGDLVFFNTSGGGISHVGIYTGNGQIIHSSSSKTGGVIYSALNSSYYASRYVGARRVIN